MTNKTFGLYTLLPLLFAATMAMPKMAFALVPAQSSAATKSTGQQTKVNCRGKRGTNYAPARASTQRTQATPPVAPPQGRRAG